MTFGQRMALNVPPLLLRLGLAFVFIYAGAGKLFYKDMPVTGESAAWLANHGFIGASKLPPVGVEGDEGGEVAAPPAETAAPDEEGVTDDADGGGANGDGAEEDDGGGDENGTGEDDASGTTAMRDASAGFVMIAVQDGGAPGDEETSAPDDGANEGAAEAAESEAEPEGRYSAADFGEPVLVARRLMLVLMMHEASEEGDWPGQLSSDLALGMLSWMAVLTEFFGGWLILLGFLTRVWALGLAGTMVVAMWLTQIAPSIGADGAFLGFLPELQIGDAAAWGSWHTLQMQVVLLLASLAVLLSGPGKVSLDAILFRRPAAGRAKRGAEGGDAAKAKHE